MARTKPNMPAELVDLHPDPWTEPFWLGAREHRLVAQRCTSCGTFRMPPSGFCRACRQQGVEWVELSGEGTVYSFIVTHQALIPQLKEYVPYVTAVVELDDAPGIRLISNLVDTEVDDVHVGLPVTVTWEDVHENATIPRFRPTADTAGAR
jgi:uncharacterized OB-fold protein